MNYGCQSMVGKIQSILIKHPENAFLNQKHLDNNWEKFNYISKPNYNKVLEEFKEFEKILIDNINKIYYLPESKKVGLDSIYTHDPIIITNKGAILLNMGKDLRKNEPHVTKKFLN